VIIINGEGGCDALVIQRCSCTPRDIYESFNQAQIEIVGLPTACRCRHIVLDQCLSNTETFAKLALKLGLVSLLAEVAVQSRQTRSLLFDLHLEHLLIANIAGFEYPNPFLDIPA
jgi:hypothetical protein